MLLGGRLSLPFVVPLYSSVFTEWNVFYYHRHEKEDFFSFPNVHSFAQQATAAQI